MVSRTHEVVIYTGNELNPDPNAGTEIGYIEELATKRKVASIVYCKTLYWQNGQHTMILKNGQYCEYEIQLDDLYFGLLKHNELVFEAMMMHETGHLVNGDFDKPSSAKEAMDQRRELLQQNKVADVELLADRFAVSQCGKKIVNAMLDQIINTRKWRGYGPGDEGIREAQLRKKAVCSM